jgi:hypothetical protein
MLAHHVISSRSCWRETISHVFTWTTRGKFDFKTRTLFLADPRWLVPCCNSIITWLSSPLLVTGGLLYGFPRASTFDWLDWDYRA